MRRIRSDLADWLSSGTLLEGTGNDDDGGDADGSPPDNVDSCVEEPDDESEGAAAEQEDRKPGAQGMVSYVYSCVCVCAG